MRWLLLLPLLSACPSPGDTDPIDTDDTEFVDPDEDTDTNVDTEDPPETDQPPDSAEEPGDTADTDTVDPPDDTATPDDTGDTVVVAWPVDTADPCGWVLHLRTELWGVEVGWNLRNSFGGLIDGVPPGSYADASDYYIPLSLPAGEYTFEALDAFADGWHGGFWEVVDQGGTQIATGAMAAGSFEEWAFESECEADTAYDTGVEACEVELHVRTENGGGQVGWNLLDDAGSVVAWVPDGSYANAEDYYVDLSLAEGVYLFEAIDAGGNGWQGGGFEINNANGATIQRGTLTAGAAGYFAVIVDCTATPGSTGGGTIVPDLVLGDPAAAECPWTVHVHTELWGDELGWSLLDGPASTIYNAPPGTYGENDDAWIELAVEPGTYAIAASDLLADGWHGGFIDVIGNNGQVVEHLALPDGTADQQITFDVECLEPLACATTVHIRTEIWANEIGWNIRDGAGGVVASQQAGAYLNATDYYTEVVLSPGSYVFEAIDTFGDGWHGGFFEVSGADGLFSTGTLDTINDDGFSRAFPTDVACATGVTPPPPVDPADLCHWNVHIRTEIWGNEVGWNVSNPSGIVVASATAGSYDWNLDYFEDLDVPAGSYVFEATDSYGDGWHAGFFEVTDDASALQLTGTLDTINDNGANRSWNLQVTCSP